MSEEVKHKHAGHRQRLKNKVKKTSLRTLEEHEIIELLLTYTIPRKDTNPIAHDLLTSFDTIDKVIDADFKDLQKVKGVGEETALFFKVISQLYPIYKQNKGEDNEKLTSPQKCVNYFRKRFEIDDDEFMLALCLSKQCRVIGNFLIYGKNECEINIDVKTFADKINVHNTDSVVIIHTHPYGDVKPSPEDIETTQKLYNICAVMGIKLADHIIVNHTEHYSFAKKFGLFNMEANCKLLLSGKQLQEPKRIDEEEEVLELEEELDEEGNKNK